MSSTKWDERQQATRAKLLSTARDLIAKEGMEGFSVRKLASGAGVAVGTIYNQFGDRSGLLSAMVTEGLDTLATSLDNTSGEHPLDPTRSLFTTLLARYEAEEALWRPLFLALKSEPGDHGLGQSGERLLNFMLADLAAAARAKMLVPGVDLDVLANHLLRDQLGLLTRWAFGAISTKEFQEHSSRSLELSLAGVLLDPHRLDALNRANLS